MGKHVTLTAGDGHTLDAYKAAPEGAPRGGLIVIQEIFGVNHHIRAVTDGYAADGYLAIAPAMFDRTERGVELGYDQDGIMKGRGLMGGLDWGTAMLDVAAAAAALGDASKTGLVGYCWGGSVAWVASVRAGLDCAIGYYGGKVIDFVGEQPACPVMLHFGDQDQGIPIDDVEKIKAAHPDVPVHRYAEAGHGFSCDERASYHAESAALARDRTLAFLGEHVG